LSLSPSISHPHQISLSKAVPWGLEIKRYEITEIMPDPQIRLAMDKQAAAERDRREHVLRAEGDKQRVTLTSEGVKISLQNESEGNLIKVRNEAEAMKIKMVREAEGQAEAILTTARAQAQALRLIAAEFESPGGAEAAMLALSKEYVKMYGEMGQKSNTMIFNDRPGDVSALLAQAVTAMNAANLSTANKTLPVSSTEGTERASSEANSKNE
jgi:regulator of protease activity HflC (stomatin/prohibitin superfamily)